jgi:hypothetical protein
MGVEVDLEWWLTPDRRVDSGGRDMINAPRKS